MAQASCLWGQQASRLLIGSSFGGQDVHLPTAETAVPLRNGRHPLAIQINLADAFDACEHVINRLAPNADEFRADDACHEIARKIEHS